jgi:hypothetical protein
VWIRLISCRTSKEEVVQPWKLRKKFKQTFHFAFDVLKDKFAAFKQ